MTESTQSPAPTVSATPELAAALANQFIEELLITHGAHGVELMRNRAEPLFKHLPEMDRAFDMIVGPHFDLNTRARLSHAAWHLASILGYPAPYETQVTLSDGHQMPAERHTITHFTDGEIGADGEGFHHEDWAAISALSVGESYVLAGASASMTVTRKE